MKKYFIAWEPLICIMPKCSLKMKLTTLFLVIALFKIQANSYSQNVKITLDLEAVKVMTVLQNIESQSDYKFLGNQNVLDNKEPGFHPCEKKTIKQCIEGSIHRPRDRL